jgi:N6-adenosine-specific RNA methylase IME4
VRSPKGEGRSASNHYGVMSLDDIKALPVADLAAEDCALFLWAIDSMLPQALDVIEAWGFTYKAVGFTWAKTNLKSDGFFTGMGYWTCRLPQRSAEAQGRCPHCRERRGHPQEGAVELCPRGV